MVKTMNSQRREALLAPLLPLRQIKGVILRTLVVCLVALVCAVPRLHAATNPIQQENSLPGTPGWNDFTASSQQDLLSGFASKSSVNHGDSIDLYVTTTAPSFTIDIYRTGYYQGIGARLVQSLGSFPGVHQAIPSPDPVTGIIACSSWASTTTVQIPSTWVTGIYLAKLTSSAGNSSFILFVVRDDGGTEDILYQASVNTYQSYNLWGGTSLYSNSTNLSVYPYAHATKVSLDRPYNPTDSNGAGQYFSYEYAFVYWMESQGYNVSYTTDVDTDQGLTPLTNHKAFLSVGHDEYWSRAMRTNVQNAINAGVNVGFFGANTMFWQIRYEANAAAVPSRVQVGYKDFATTASPPGPDPQWGFNNSIVTTNWRDPTINQPENGIVGIMYEGAASASYVVQNASNWVYANTGFVNGSSVPGIVGYEYDKVWNNGFTPPGLIVLSTSPLKNSSGVTSNSNSSIYTAPSGANVFASGTIEWSLGLANVMSNTLANAGIQQTTANILNNFILGVPEATFSTSTVTFSGTLVGATSAPQTITLTSSGTGTLVINSIGLTGANAADYSQTNNCPATLGVSQSCTINVSFTPSAAGTRTANVTITDSASSSPQNIALSGTGQAAGAPIVSLSPASLSFGSQNVGTSSAPQSTTLSNIGTAPLSISSIAITGTNPGDFSAANTCPSSLAANSSCTISVTFTPVAGGTRSANVMVTDNASDSPESVLLTGSAIAPTIYFKDGFETGDFSLWNLPSSDSTGQRTVQKLVVNSGTYAAAFTDTGAQYGYIYTALAAPQSQTFTRFYFRLTSLANSSAIALGRNVNSANSWEIDFDAARNGLDFYFWNSAGATYSIFSPTGSIAVNTWYCVEIADTQTTSGQAQGWLNGALLGTVNADLSNANPYARLMLYNSVAGSFYFDDVVVSNLYNGPLNPAPAANLNPASLTFGSQVVNTASSAQAITLTNQGSLPLSISSIALSGTNSGDFAQTNNCPTGSSTLAVNASCTINVTFTPTATGTRTAGVTITDNDPTSPQNVPLSGLGTSAAAGITLTPTSLSYNSQVAGTTSAVQTVTVKSTGTSPLSISSITLSGTNPGDFSQANNCPTGSSTLAVNASCTISITFTPTATGTRTASVTITDNAASSPQNVSLSGTGQATAGPIVSLSPASLSFGSQSVGASSAPQTTTLSNTGTAPLSISSIAITGTNPGDFSATNTCPSSLAANSSCTISVTFTPVAGGTRSANVTVTDNAADSPESVALTGSAVTSTIYFKDGFETGDFSLWNLPSSDSTGQRTVQKIVVNSGTYAAAFTNTSGQYGYIYTALAAPQSQTFTRFYFRLTSLTNSSAIAVGRNANNANAWEIDFDAARKGLDFYFWNSAGATYTIFSPTGSIAVNTWYCVEIQDTQTTTGQGQGWLNGVSVGTVSADLSNANPYARLMLYNSVAGSFYFDDVVVSNLYNGPLTPAPAANLNPASLTFGSQIVNTASSAQALTLTNQGSLPLSVSSIALSGTNPGDFAQTNNCPTGSSTLAVNASCTINVTFTPTATGTRSATLVLTDNDPASPQNVPLSGTGTNGSASITLTPTSLTYSSQLVGTTSAVQTITVKSTGTTPVSISSIALSGANPGDFAQTNNCPAGSSTLAVNASCTISVTFTPTANGTRTGTLTVNSNASGMAPSTSLSGTAIAPVASLSPTSLAFATLRLNTTSAEKKITLTNKGNSVMTIKNIGVTGDFAETNNCSSTLAVGANCTVDVTFTPTASGSRTGTLTVTDNASESPQSVSLTGTGVDFDISASPSSATVTAGSTASYSVAVSALGGDFTWTVNLGCSGLPSGSKCTFSGSPVTPGTTSGSAGLSISTSSGSKAPPAGSYTVTITGTSGALQHTTSVTLQVK